MHSLLRAVLLGVVCIAGLPREGQAQRQVKHLNSFNFQYGGATNGSFLRLGYSRFIKDKNRFDLVAMRESGHLDSFSGPQASYFGYDLGLGLAPTLFHIGEVFYMHLTTQVHARYDRVEATEQADVRQGFSAGPDLGFTGDIYLSDWLSISGQASQGYLFLSPPGTSWPRYYGAGLNFHFR
jgi:hypothetical protein